MKKTSRHSVFASLLRWGLFHGFGSAGICLAIAGCSQGPSAIPKLSVNASSASAAAIKLYDSDGDGELAEAELEKAPGIKAGLKKADTNGDGKISRAELAARMETWNASRYAILPISCGVTLDGARIEGAKVVFEPEPFLDDAVRQGVGISNDAGLAGVSIPKENRLVADSPPGLQMGYYIVRITKEVDGKELIPAKYNTESILGQEVAYDDPAVQSQINFSMVTK